MVIFYFDICIYLYMLVGMKTTPLPCALDKLEPEALKRASDILRTLAHPDRLRIIDLLHTAGELPVGEITGFLGIHQATTSQHLNHMRRIGLLGSDRRGKEVWYAIADDRPVALLNCICSCCGRNE